MWMDNKLRKQVQATVKSHCANYVGGECVLLGGECIYDRKLLPGQETDRCKYAEQAVLANSPLVESEYNEKLARYLGKADARKEDIGVCKDCRGDYVRRSNRQVRCPECQAKASKSSHAISKRRYRSKRA